MDDQFLWGSATSAHQVEGGCTNDWTEWEKEKAGQLASQSSSRWSRQQQEQFSEMRDPLNYVSGSAAGHYKRFKEDIALAAELGHTAHRFSVEWSRVEPQKGIYNQEAIHHYKEVVATIRSYNMEPIVTLWHFTLPTWVANKGGWTWRRAPRHFKQFTEIIAEALGDDVRYWITINEPMIYATNATLKGVWPPQQRNPLAMIKTLYRLREAHRSAEQVIHARKKTAMVGIAKNGIDFDPVGGGVWNKMLAKVADWWWNRWFLNGVRGRMDFIGINYYFHSRVDGWFNHNENKEVSDMGWEIYPDGLYAVLKRMQEYGLPLIITENGVADADDLQRERFIKEHITAMRRAIKEGVDVRGYIYWSLLDNFEWDKGFWPRFGLIGVDYGTMKRTIRPSALVLKSVIEKDKQKPR